MKTERRWLKSAIHAATTEGVALPWGQRQNAQTAPAAQPVIFLGNPAPAALHYAIAAR
jgi:hypothetical protein